MASRSATARDVAWLATIGLGLGLAGYVAVRRFGERPVDYQVYRLAAHSVLHGRFLYDVFLQPFHLGFTYPPFAALVLLPLDLVPAAAGYALDVVVSALALTWVWHSVQRHTDLPRRWLIPCLVASVVLEPIWENPDLGQLNLVLQAMVLADLLRPRGAPARGLWTGVAAGFKLTPLAFLGLLAITRQWRALAYASTGFGATIAIGWVVLPHDSVFYWTHALGQTQRFGRSAYDNNQSVFGVLLRAAGPHTSITVPWLVTSVVVGLACLATAAFWWRRDERVLALGLAALAELFAAPVSWTHHWVWCLCLGVPLVGALVRAGVPRRWGIAATVLWFGCFVAAPQLWVPRHNDREFGWSVGQSLVGDAYVELALLLLVLLSATAWRLSRRDAPEDRLAAPG